MKIVVPDWYPRFRCKAGECKHTCCAGWEIDIDEESRARYEALPGEMGQRVRKAMVADENGAHFRLTEAGRCPLLNDNGLCDLILSSGGSVVPDLHRSSPLPALLSGLGGNGAGAVL